MSGALHRWGLLCARHAGLVVAAWVIAVAGVITAVAVLGDETDDTLRLPGADSQAAYDLLEAEFPPQQNGSSPVVFHATSGEVDDAKEESAIRAAVEAIAKVEHVASVTDPFAQPQAGLVSKEERTAFAPVLLDVTSNDLTEDDAQAVLDAARPARDAGLQVEAGGPIGSALAPVDTESSERVGLLAAMVVLAITFGSLVAMGLPILTAVIGLSVGLGGVGLLGHVLQVPTVGPTLATMIGLGVGIDYALFLVSRHRAQLTEGMELHESVARTIATAGGAVVFAGGTVVIALLSLGVAGIPFVTSLGVASATAVLTAVLAAISLLPAILALLGHKVQRLRVPLVGGSTRPPAETFWGRLASAVTLHPAVTVAVAVVLLLPLVVPLSRLALGQEDVGAEPTSTTERRAFDLVSEGFGPGYNGVLVVANALDPPASPSATYTEQHDEAESLKSDLEKMQDALTAQADELESEQAGLEAEESSLRAQQAGLEREKQSLEVRQRDLARRAQRLRRQARAARAEAADLREQAASLRADVRSQRASLRADRRELAENLAEQAALRRAIEAAEGDPVVVERLETELARLEETAETMRASLAADRTALRADAAEARDLVAEARALVTRVRLLGSRARSLAADEAALARQAAALEASASRLRSEGGALQSQADALRTQGDELKQEKKVAEAEKKQAQRLQSQITDELTKAGGDPRGTDPRLVAEQDALEAIGTDGGVQVVGPPVVNKSGTAAYFSVVPTTRPADPGTASLVRHLRDDVLPPVAGAQGLTVHVGGTTATNVDLAELIASRLLLVILTVLLLSFALLVLAFRSLLIPLQAALTNLLSVAAAFGVLTACFQWGWGLGVTGVDTSAGSVPVASYVPLMMFAALFGLSMDYEVFLVSQVVAARARGASATEAVREGVASAAKVIAAAALIMISVFGSFVLNGSPVVKQFGVGLSTAVLLAGAMVLTFAPAVLVLMGERTFALPGLLERALPDLDVEGAHLDERLPAGATASSTRSSGSAGPPDPPGPADSGPSPQPVGSR